MKQYKIQITDIALSDMKNIYKYIADQLQSPITAMEQYNRIADAIETLSMFPERVKLMESEDEFALGLRQMPVDNYSVFFLYFFISEIIGLSLRTFCIVLAIYPIVYVISDQLGGTIPTATPPL